MQTMVEHLLQIQNCYLLDLVSGWSTAGFCSCAFAIELKHKLLITHRLLD